MVSLSQRARGGSSGEGVCKGVTGEAKPVAPAAWEGESFRQKESRNTALTSNVLCPWGHRARPRPRQEAAPTLAVPTERKLPGADRRLVSHVCAIAHLQYWAHCKAKGWTACV